MKTDNPSRKTSISMPEPNIWKEANQIRLYEVDCHHRLSVLSIFNFMQEAASRHAEALGVSIQQLLSDNLLGDPKASGRLRAIPVSIGTSVYEPLAVPQLIDEIFRQILSIASAISDPYERSCQLYHLVRHALGEPDALLHEKPIITWRVSD
jgi:hypothetical protein